MGLDNGFRLRDRQYPEHKIEFAYFRKFYELDDWVLQHCREAFNDNEWERVVSKEDIDSLIVYIRPIAEAILKLDESKVNYYDDKGWPKSFEKDFYGNDFNPFLSRSFAPGWKLIKLYHAMVTLADILEDYDNKNLYVTFYSSF